MLRKVRGFTAVALVVIMFFSFTTTTQAGWFDKAKNWAKGAAEDVKEATDKAKDWTEGAAEDATNWTEGAVEDANNWTEGAVEDASNWTAGAVEDAANWTEGAVEDTAGFLEDAFAEEVEEDELGKLPLLTLNEAELKNLFNSSYGSFTSLENVKNKKLSSDTYTKLKNEINKIGVPGYIVDFILENVAGVEGDNIGGAIADLLPGSVIYGDSVASAINSIVNNEDFVDVDFYTEELEPQDQMNGFKAYYDIPVASNPNLQGDVLLVATGAKYGKRDDFQVVVSTIDKNGQETKVPVVKKALNGKEVGFEAQLKGINSNIDKIRVAYDNKFDKPKEPSRLIADGIKDAINGLAGPFNPISNATRNNIIKVLDQLDLNELGGNGDVGVVIADNIIGQIPAVGTALKLVDGTQWLGKQIRMIVGQVEVRSYAGLEGARILVKNYGSATELVNGVNNATQANTAPNLETTAYDYHSNIPNMKYLGETWFPRFSEEEGMLICQTPDKGHAVAYIKDKEYDDFVASTKIKLNGSGNAGLEFRIANVKGNQNQFQGYMAGVALEENGAGQVFFGKQNYNWERIKTVNATIEKSEEYILKVAAVGSNIKIYLNDQLMIDINDNSYQKGYIGYQVWNNYVILDDLVIITNQQNKEFRDVSMEAPVKIEENTTVPMNVDFSTQAEFMVVDGKFTGNKAYGHSMYATPLGEDDTYGTFYNSNFKNGTVQSKITLYDPVNGELNTAGFTFRVSSYDTGKSNYDGYYVGLVQGASGGVLLKAVHSGQEKILGTYKTNIQSRTVYDLKVNAQDSQIDVYLNGEKIISTSDSIYKEGKVGLSNLRIPAIYQNLTVTK